MSTNADCMPGSTRVTRPLKMLPAKACWASCSMKSSTRRSFSRMANLVSCTDELTISSLDTGHLLGKGAAASAGRFFLRMIDDKQHAGTLITRTVAETVQSPVVHLPHRRSNLISVRFAEHTDNTQRGGTEEPPRLPTQRGLASFPYLFALARREQVDLRPKIFRRGPLRRQASGAGCGALSIRESPHADVIHQTQQHKRGQQIRPAVTH